MKPTNGWTVAPEIGLCPHHQRVQMVVLVLLQLLTLHPWLLLHQYLNFHFIGLITKTTVLGL